MRSRSRGRNAPSRANHSPRKGGRGEHRVPNAPAASRATSRKHTSVVTTGPPLSPCDPIARPTLPRPPHLVPNVRDDRDTPLVRAETGESVEMICPTPKAKYFCKGGLDRWNHLDPTGELSVCAHAARGRKSRAAGLAVSG